MNSSDASLLIMLCAIAGVIIIALAVVLFFTYRSITNSRNLENRRPSTSLPPIQPWRPESLPPPWTHQEDAEPPIEKRAPYILFASDKPSSKKQPRQIAWGDPDKLPSGKYNSELCPLCKNVLGLKKTVACGKCDTIYHKDCWGEFGNKCANCKSE